jgi:hypothetical protein
MPMMNRLDPNQNLNMVDMLIRALTDEMADERSRTSETESPDALLTQMEEALYELRLRKMVLRALN